MPRGRKRNQRKSAIKRQVAENEQRARQQRQRAYDNRRKARNHVDTTVKTTVHDTTCGMFAGKGCTCGVA